ncbi:ABC transporter permease [Akkermansiaceae bacterium]|nr:ABC transporter permease [Akkermansiaceae bacterium]
MNTWTIFKREFSSYFSQPTAYAIIVIFSLLSIGLTFTFGRFWDFQDASLNHSFFWWHPLLFMILAPAVSMRMWADEHRSGTIELLGTMPVPLRSAILGKFLAAATVWAIALLLTFPIVIAVNSLGEPDNWAIFSGYIGSFLVCCTFLAITSLISAFTRDQVVALIISVALCFLLTVCGIDQVINELRRSWSKEGIDILSSIGVYSHFQETTRGLIRLPTLVYFFGLISVCLVGTNLVLKSQRA